MTLSLPERTRFWGFSPLPRMTGRDFPAPKPPLPGRAARPEPPRGRGQRRRLGGRGPAPLPGGPRPLPGMLSLVPGLGISVPRHRGRSHAGVRRGSAPEQPPENPPLPPCRLVKESRKMREKKKNPPVTHFGPKSRESRSGGKSWGAFGSCPPQPGVGRGCRSRGGHGPPPFQEGRDLTRAGKTNSKKPRSGFCSQLRFSLGLGCPGLREGGVLPQFPLVPCPAFRDAPSALGWTGIQEETGF